MTSAHSTPHSPLASGSACPRLPPLRGLSTSVFPRSGCAPGAWSKHPHTLTQPCSFHELEAPRQQHDTPLSRATPAAAPPRPGILNPHLPPLRSHTLQSASSATQRAYLPCKRELHPPFQLRQPLAWPFPSLHPFPATGAPRLPPPPHHHHHHHHTTISTAPSPCQCLCPCRVYEPAGPRDKTPGTTRRASARRRQLPLPYSASLFLATRSSPPPPSPPRLALSTALLSMPPALRPDLPPSRARHCPQCGPRFLPLAAARLLPAYCQ